MRTIEIKNPLPGGPKVMNAKKAELHCRKGYGIMEGGMIRFTQTFIAKSENENGRQLEREFKEAHFQPRKYWFWNGDHGHDKTYKPSQVRC